MLKKSILIEQKSSVTCKNLQLIIKNKVREASIPIEDIGFIVIDNPEIYISITAFNLLIDNNTAVIIIIKQSYDNISKTLFAHWYYSTRY